MTLSKRKSHSNYRCWSQFFVIVATIFATYKNGLQHLVANHLCDHFGSLFWIATWNTNSVPLITLCRYAQKSWRYMDIYRKGLTGKVAEFANKKYKSHRQVPDMVYDEINNVI